MSVANSQLKRAGLAAAKWTAARARLDEPLGPIKCLVYRNPEMAEWALRPEDQIPDGEGWTLYASVDHNGTVVLENQAR